MRKLFFIGAIMILSVQAAYALKADVSANTAPVYAWEKFELDVSADTGEANPYDYSLVTVKGYFKNPAGTIKEAYGFYMEDFSYDAAGDSYTPGKGGFKIRFTFNRTGDWAYAVKVFIKKKQVYASAWKPVKVKKPSVKKGFVRISPADPLFLEYDNKEPFFAIGENLCWWREKCLPEYASIIKKLAENGANTIRVWMAPWSFGIEWDGPIGNYGHRQKQAYMLDSVFRLAEENNMLVELCLVAHGEFSEKTNPEWLNNPYNFINDGLLNTPAEFFTDPVAKKAFQNRLRYIIARWGYSTSLLAWELFNEADLTDNYDPAASAAWHGEMADYIKKYDVSRHLVTTSFSSRFKDPAVWKLEGIDFTQTHSYDMKDEAGKIYELCSSRLEAFPKPHIIGEFGIDTGPEPIKAGADREGVCLHNALWAGAFTLSFGAPLPWYWEWYVDDFNLYYHFSPLAEFIKGISWPKEDLTEIKNRQVMYKSSEGRKGGDVVFYPGDTWEKAKKNVFTVKNDGSMVNEDYFSAYLFGSGKEDMRNDPVIAFKNERPVRVVIKLNKVSDDNMLCAEINRMHVMSVTVSAKDFDTKKYFEEWKIYQADISREFTLEVPEGDNEIYLSNKGRDWIKIESIKIEEFLDARIAPVFMSGVQGPASAYVWVKSGDYGWQKGPGKPVKDAYFDIVDLKEGRYVVTFFETYTGSVIAERDDIIDRDMPLRIELPEFSKDMAVKVRKYKK